MTKTVRIHETGSPDVLRIEDLPVGDPGPGEIRIRVESHRPEPFRGDVPGRTGT